MPADVLTDMPTDMPTETGHENLSVAVKCACQTTHSTDALGSVAESFEDP